MNKRPKLFCCIFMLIMASFVWESCRSSSPVSKPAQPVITVSILPLKYLTQRITGDRFTINVMVPPGDNVESYEPVAMQMKDLSLSSLYLMIGHLPFELSQKERFQSVNPEMGIIDLSVGVNLLTGNHYRHAEHSDAIHSDPHIWLSPISVRYMVKNILEAVIRIDPEQSSYYRNNYEILTRDINQLDSLFLSAFQGAVDRSFMVFHPAWSYLARDYHLEQIAIEWEGKSPSPADIRRLIDQGRQNHIRIIFIQKQFDTADAQTIADEIGARVVVLDPVAEDWLIAMKHTAEILSGAMKPNE